MSVDWITVAAQIVNFLLLIWLLKRFLYRPILDGIEAREAEIAARMGEAAAIRASAEARESDCKARVAELSSSRAALLAAARRDAEAERDALLAETRDRLAREQAEREARRAEEAARFTAGLHRTGAEALVALTRKALADLADETLERRIVLHAAAQLNAMADDLQEAAGPARAAVALTRDPLPEELQQRLRSDLAAVLEGVTLRFETDPALSPGLNLRLGGAQVGWTVDSYLNGLEAVLERHAERPLSKAISDAA
ncbi:MAG: F0F1 ATP synthase subunit B [Rhodobacteraceae bacterium]|nr:MAG: F0F1 ATP synthase subunit B [Paracoccaceae bacterium]